LNFSSTIHS
jgi:hypothetical protein